MKLEFSRQIFEKSSNIKFHENLSSGSRVVPCGQTDGQPWRSWLSFFAILRTRLKTPWSDWSSSLGTFTWLTLHWFEILRKCRIGFIFQCVVECKFELHVTWCSGGSWVAELSQLSLSIPVICAGVLARGFELRSCESVLRLRVWTGAWWPAEVFLTELDFSSFLRCESGWG